MTPDGISSWAFIVGILACLLAAASSRNWNGWDFDVVGDPRRARRWWIRAYVFWFGLLSLSLSVVTAGQGSWQGLELALSGGSLRSVILVGVSIVSLAVSIILRATARSTSAPVAAPEHGRDAPAQSRGGHVTAHEHTRPPLRRVVAVLAILTAIAAMVVLLILDGVGSGI